MRKVFWVVSLLCWWALNPVVSAQQSVASTDANDDVARGLFQAGKASFAAGNYEDALQYFEQSYARSHRPTLLYNLGLAADRLRQDDKALASFKAYLDQVPQAENRVEVEGRIRALEKAQVEHEATTAPTPEQTAHNASIDQTRNDVSLTATEPRDEAPQTKPITKQWWFWTGVGAVIVGGVIAAIAVSSGGDKQAAPIESHTGVTIMTLRAR